MGSFSAFVILFGCIALLVVVAIVFAVFAALFGRRRRWGAGYPGYYDRPRPWFSGLFFGDMWRRREFYEPRREFRRERFEHERHREHEHFQQQHHHHPGGGFGGGGHHGGGGGGGHHGGHH